MGLKHLKITWKSIFSTRGRLSAWIKKCVGRATPRKVWAALRKVWAALPFRVPWQQRDNTTSAPWRWQRWQAKRLRNNALGRRQTRYVISGHSHILSCNKPPKGRQDGRRFLMQFTKGVQLLHPYKWCFVKCLMFGGGLFGCRESGACALQLRKQLRVSVLVDVIEDGSSWAVVCI